MRFLRWLLLILLLLAVAAGAAAYYGYTLVHEPYKAYGGPEQFVDVPSGAGPATIAERLVDAGVVRDHLLFRGALLLTGRARELKAGEYRFDRPMSPVEVVEKIARGDVYRRRITFREGLTIVEMTRVYDESGLGKGADFEHAAREGALIHDLDATATDLEGYLFPETYTLRRETPAAALVAQMVDAFRKVFDESLRKAAEAHGLSVRQAVTLASLVEKEAALPEERPMIAAVYLNRKRVGMPMQADPTIVYVMQRAGTYKGNIRKEDLDLDSPYNTYRNPGLPPGPIAAPGKASLVAAVNPADVDYLYFVSRNDGSHVFARTLEEHNRNVYEWQVKYFRQKKAQAEK
jgi:peptidoglycan lytic transglycosylase G